MITAEKISDHQLRLLEVGRALDIELIGEPAIDTGIDGVWELFGYWDDVEYFWGSTGVYAGSIARSDSGRYFASPDHRFRHLCGARTALGELVCIWYR
jgi:hypothetical protein